MWTRRSAGHSHGANNLPAFYFLAHDNKDLAEVPVFGRYPISVIHDNLVTVAGIPPRLHDNAIPVRVQRGLRIGIIIADDFAAVFAPPALNVDVFPSAGVPNAGKPMTIGWNTKPSAR